MNVKLDSVIANITGLTGQRILRAIIDGERDPERLATLRHRGIKADADTIAASLQGRGARSICSPSNRPCSATTS